MRTFEDSKSEIIWKFIEPVLISHIKNINCSITRNKISKILHKQIYNYYKRWNKDDIIVICDLANNNCKIVDSGAISVSILIRDDIYFNQTHIILELDKNSITKYKLRELYY